MPETMTATPFARGATLDVCNKPTLDLAALSMEMTPSGPLFRATPDMLLLLAQAGLVGLTSLLQTRGLSAEDRHALQDKAERLAPQLEEVILQLDPGFNTEADPSSPAAASAIACLKVLERQLGSTGQ
ncbi:MAG: hypothetical protein Alpg2KO_00110 [Alphaproteobacteria bacterium]